MRDILGYVCRQLGLYLELPQKSSELIFDDRDLLFSFSVVFMFAVAQAGYPVFPLAPLSPGGKV
jgi:hypothetical protein